MNRVRTDIEAWRREHQVSLHVEETTIVMTGGEQGVIRQFAWACKCGRGNLEHTNFEACRIEALAHVDPFHNLYGEFAPEGFSDDA